MGSFRRWHILPNEPSAPFGGNAKYIFVGLTAIAAISLTVIALNVAQPVSNAQPGPVPTFGTVKPMAQSFVLPAAGAPVLILGDSC